MSLGRGISIRRSMAVELADRLARGDSSIAQRMDWFEIVPENFMGRGGPIRRALLQLSEAFPMTLHGVSLSIGSVDPLDWNYLAQVKKLLQETRARWVTDHLCFSSFQGVQFHSLLPLPFTEKAVQHVVSRVKQVQDYLGVPFGLENPSYYVVMPGAEMSEAQFLKEILERSGCSLLLDINNLYVNSFNHPCLQDGNYDPLQGANSYLREIPLERIIEVHVAGFETIELAGKALLLDTHGEFVSEVVQTLLEDLESSISVDALLLERESNIPILDVLLDEISTLWKRIKKFERPARADVTHSIWKAEFSQPFDRSWANSL